MIKASADADIFDTSVTCPTWDFFPWIVGAECLRRRWGVGTHMRIRFKTARIDRPVHGADDMSVEMRKHMLRHVVRPSLALMGGKEDPSIHVGNGQHYTYWWLCDAARKGWEIPKVNVAAKRVPNRITITLRESAHGAYRNSNVGAWIDFGHRRRAEGYEVIFVRDTARADEPIEDFLTAPEASRVVLERAKLYASAGCNLLSSNGPASLLIFSDTPFVYFVDLIEHPGHAPTTRHWWRTIGGIRPPGDRRFPWNGEHQQIVWMRDSLENIEGAWRVQERQLVRLEDRQWHSPSPTPAASPGILASRTA